MYQRLNQQELDKILDSHGSWVASPHDGNRANLKGKDLRGLSFRGRKLYGINLSKTFMQNADLNDTDLHSASFEGAILKNASLRNSRLKNVKLASATASEADFSDSDLRGSNLKAALLLGANLTNARLRNTILECTDFEGANLTNTCLDPNAEIQPIADEDLLLAGLEIINDRVYGYRSRTSRVMRGFTYDLGMVYTAPVFSISSTPCHPGIYIAGIDFLKDHFTSFTEIVRCWCYRKDLHKAGDKFRCRELHVTEDQPKLLGRR